jgi:hypothetical protein
MEGPQTNIIGSFTCPFRRIDDLTRETGTDAQQIMCDRSPDHRKRFGIKMETAYPARSLRHTVTGRSTMMSGVIHIHIAAEISFPRQVRSTDWHGLNLIHSSTSR